MIESIIQPTNKQTLEDGRIARLEEKHVDLMTELITRYTNDEGLVMDCFCGTGSSAVACARLQRIYYGNDFDEEVAKIATERVYEEVKYIMKQSKYFYI